MGDTTCISCEAGKYNDAGTSKKKLSDGSQCKDCAAGRYNDQVGQETCVLCEFGKSQSDEGEESCPTCLKGQYTPAGGGATNCPSCPAGSFSQDPTTASTDNPVGYEGTSCQNCNEGQDSNSGASGCFQVLDGSAFTTCPEYVVGDTGVAGTTNECTYLYGGHWKTVSQSSPSPYGNTCLDYEVCGRSHGKKVVDVDGTGVSYQDEYYLMCTQCAEGYVPASLNSDGQWVEAFAGSDNSDLCSNQGINPEKGCLKTFRDVCQDNTNPVYCYKKTDLSFCPDPFVGEDDPSHGEADADELPGHTRVVHHLAEPLRCKG